MKRYISILFSLLLTLTVAAQQKDFKFVQLTDIHLSPKNEQPTIDLLKSIAQINATDSIDFVLVTGDLTEEGDNATLEKVKECLSLLKYPFYVVMGNHETKWSESGCTKFQEIFGGERFSFQHKGFLFLGFNTGPLMRMAFGHVVPQDISWIKSEIEKCKKGQPVILVTHYPLLKGDVDNWYELTDAVRPYNIKMFIGGHYHRNKHFSYDGIPGILTRSNLSNNTGKPGYGLFEVKGDSVLISECTVGEMPKKWAAISLNHSYYNHDRKADEYPDYSINNQYNNVKEEWVIQTGAGIYSSPVCYKQRIFVGDDAGRLTSYSLKNGKKIWQFHAKARIVGTLDVADDVVVFGSADSHIYGLNYKNGEVIWKIQAKAPILGAVTIDSGIAYIGGSDHSMHAIDIQTGKEVWTYSKVKGYIETKPLVTKNKIIFGAWDNTLYALDKSSGKELWRWTGGLTRMHFSPAAVWPVATEKRVFIVDPQRAITAIDIENGKTVWRTFQSKVRETIGISQDQARIYAKTMQDSIVCYSTEGDTPQELWATNIGFGYEHATSMMVEKDNIVYGSTKDGLIFAVRPKDGKIIWIHKIGNSLINTVFPIDKKKIIFTETSGELGILRTK